MSILLKKGAKKNEIETHWKGHLTYILLAFTLLFYKCPFPCAIYKGQLRCVYAISWKNFLRFPFWPNTRTSTRFACGTFLAKLLTRCLRQLTLFLYFCHTTPCSCTCTTLKSQFVLAAGITAQWPTHTHTPAGEGKENTYLACMYGNFIDTQLWELLGGWLGALAGLLPSWKNVCVAFNAFARAGFGSDFGLKQRHM